MPGIRQQIRKSNVGRQLDRRPVHVAERRAQVCLRQSRRYRNLQDRAIAARPRPKTVREQERGGGDHDDRRRVTEQRGNHDQDKACPEVDAQQLGDERQVRPHRRRQQADQKVNRVVVTHGRARAPRQLRRKSAGSKEGGQPHVHFGVRYSHELAAGQRSPKERQDRDREPGEQPGRRPEAVARPPRQAHADRDDDAPAHRGPGKPGDDIQDEVDDQSPDRGADDETLGQGHALVVLTQGHPHDDVTHGGQRGELRRQQQQARKHRRINGHSATLAPHVQAFDSARSQRPWHGRCGGCHA